MKTWRWSVTSIKFHQLVTEQWRRVSVDVSLFHPFSVDLRPQECDEMGTLAAEWKCCFAICGVGSSNRLLWLFPQQPFTLPTNAEAPEISGTELELNEMTRWIYPQERDGQSIPASSKRTLLLLPPH